MIIQEHIRCFSLLGEFFSAVAADSENASVNSELFDEFKQTVDNTIVLNPWFTWENILYSLKSLSAALTETKLKQWIERYDNSLFEKKKKIGVIMAGNIPMVGFHDMLSVLITGNIFVGKLSSKDDQLLKAVSNYLICLNPEYKNRIVWEESKLTGIDAVIATGSDNTSRYFEYYFGKYPNIIRRNRNSVAILTGRETVDDIRALAEDIFVYFGLGCRNVSKLFVPEGYDFGFFFRAIEHWNPLANHNKYANNYEYNRAIYLVNLVPHLDNGFLLVKEQESISSPIAVMFYEFYKDFEILKERVIFDIEKIQCVVGKTSLFDNEVRFGQTQHPELWDYADNIDTIEFLSGI